MVEEVAPHQVLGTKVFVRFEITTAVEAVEEGLPRVAKEGPSGVDDGLEGGFFGEKVAAHGWSKDGALVVSKESTRHDGALDFLEFCQLKMCFGREQKTVYTARDKHSTFDTSDCTHHDDCTAFVSGMARREPKVKKIEWVSLKGSRCLFF